MSIVAKNVLRETARRMNNWSRFISADASEALRCNPCCQPMEDTPSTERAELSRIRYLVGETLDFFSQRRGTSGRRNVVDATLTLA